MTGAAISRTDSEYEAGIAFGFGGDPSQTHVALSALHSAAYSCGVGAFAAMAAALIKRTYDRMSARG